MHKNLFLKYPFFKEWKKTRTHLSHPKTACYFFHNKKGYSQREIANYLNIPEKYICRPKNEIAQILGQ